MYELKPKVHPKLDEAAEAKLKEIFVLMAS
jgi:hypothetical protein